MSVVLPNASVDAPQNIDQFQGFRESWHRFVPKMQTFSRQAYDRFRDKLLGESENLKFLKSELDLLDGESQNRIASLMNSANPYGLEGHQLRLILKDCNDEVRTAIIEKALDQSGIDFEKVARFVELKGDIAEMAECLPKPNLSKQHSIQHEIGKTFRVVTRFFPNFLDNVLKAFSVIDSVKSPETLWDFSAVMNIYFKLFMIPHALFVVVGTVVSAPASLFLITGGLIALSVVGICLYLKYRPCPNKLPLSTNLTEEALKGNLEPVVGRDQDIKKVSAYLGNKSDGIHTNIFLVGPSGVGKTELVKGIAQYYREKKIFSLSAPELTSGYSAIGAKIRLLLLDIKDHNDEVILFIDELGKAIKMNSGVDLAGMLNPLIGPNGVQVIVAATEDEYNNHVIKEDTLCARFIKIPIKPTDEAQTLAILRSRMENKGGNIRFEEGIEQHIYKMCQKAQLPRTAVNMLDLAINYVSSCDFEKFDSKRLAELKSELKERRSEYQRALDQKPETKGEIVQDIKELVKEIEEQAKKDQAMVQLALKTKGLIKMEREYVRKRRVLLRDLSKESEVLFLHHHLLPWIRGKIKENLKKIPKEFPMQVNKTLIDEVGKLGLK